METVLSRAGLKVGDRVEVLSTPTGLSTDVIGEHYLIEGYGGADKVDLHSIPDNKCTYLFIENVNISSLRLVLASDPQPEDEAKTECHDHDSLLETIKAKMSGEEFRGYCKAQAVDLILNGGGIASVSKAVSLLNCMLEQANENAQD